MYSFKAFSKLTITHFSPWKKPTATHGHFWLPLTASFTLTNLHNPKKHANPPLTSCFLMLYQKATSKTPRLPVSDWKTLFSATGLFPALWPQGYTQTRLLLSAFWCFAKKLPPNRQDYLFGIKLPAFRCFGEKLARNYKKHVFHP